MQLESRDTRGRLAFGILALLMLCTTVSDLAMHYNYSSHSSSTSISLLASSQTQSPISGFDKGIVVGVIGEGILIWIILLIEYALW